MAELRKHLAIIAENLKNAERKGEPTWPLNEADTERLVIEPVLRALGYGDLDYGKRVHGVGANFPDYLILPGTDAQWVLEAKEWDKRLEERDERQAVNYANNNGAQWAVLTNGKTWRIYNTRVPGDLTQQRVSELEDLTEMEKALDILQYLSRSSMQDGELEKLCRAREIQNAVVALLKGQDRSVINAIRRGVARDLDRNVTVDDITAALKAILDDGPPPPPPVKTAWYSLVELARKEALCTGRRPVEMESPTGKKEPVSTWREMVLRVLKDIPNAEAIPIPLQTGKGKRYFANTSPVHVDGHSMIKPECIVLGGRKVYIDVHRSARDLASSLEQVMRICGLEPADLKVRLDKA